MAPRYLTKSRFKQAVECPTKLYYASHSREYRNNKNDDTFLQSLAEGGFQVGELAKRMYPSGHEITSKDSSIAEAETAEWLKQDVVTLFEPAISFGNLFIRIDILVKRGNTFRLIEVKAKSCNSEELEIRTKRGNAIASGMLPYIEDVAFQSYVLRQAFPGSSVASFLMMPDKSKVATIDGLNQLFKVRKSGRQTEIITDPRLEITGYGEKVLTEVNVDEFVDMVMEGGVEYPGGKDTLPALAKRWSEAYEKDVRIPQAIGAQCGKCEFRAEPGEPLKSGFHECWKEANHWGDRDFSGGTVLDLWNYRGKAALISHGILKLSQVTEEDLKLKEADEGLNNSHRQWMQVAGLSDEDKARGFYCADDLMLSAMAGWKYPYHLIDFETSSVALPFYKGMRPYEQIAFQFSHHVMNADGSVHHVGECLLTEPGDFPNYEFARALKVQLDRDGGSVFMWSPHENTILNRIVTQLKEDANPPVDAVKLRTFLLTLIKGGERAMVDLCALAQKAYFHPDTRGSNSIKKVLPAVLKSSDFLHNKYAQPIYGAEGGMRSLNYQDYVWLKPDENGKVDPYNSLKTYIADMTGEDEECVSDDDEFSIAEGGAAASAYSRLQFESMADDERGKINHALLRYCELDTLAMVMIVEAWQECCGIQACCVEEKDKTNKRFSIDDLMVLDAESDPVPKVYIRELLDYPSSEFQRSKLSSQQKMAIINALGLDNLTKMLVECFRRKGSTDIAEYEAKFAWQMLSGKFTEET